MSGKSPTLPLAGVRVVEMTDGLLDMTGRLLADLGADVIRIEVPANAGPDRRRAAPGDNVDVRYLIENANKTGVVMDPTSPAGNDRLWSLLSSADILIRASHRAGDHVLDSEEVRTRFPQLVILSISDFGRTGPYKDFVATDAVHLAMGSQLSRSGAWPREPCLVPFDMAYQSSATQAAWAALVAYYRRLEIGNGDVIDFSVFEAAIEVVDPPFGTSGTATAGTKQIKAGADPDATEWSRPRSRPYPIYPCADGFVRCLVLAPNQWRAMYAWLGEPTAFAGPEFLTILGRNRERKALDQAYVEFFRTQTKSQLATEGQVRGVPIVPVLTLSEVAAQDHFQQRGAFIEAEIGRDLRAVIPSGFVEIDGERIGFRHCAPLEDDRNEPLIEPGGRHAGHPPQSISGTSPREADATRLPLSGVRVIDFGSIVFGAELGRLFADLGADVIKIENRAFPDKYRGTSEPGSHIAKNFALGNRGRRSFGVDTRTDQGREIVKRLVASADVVVSNFKPGTLERLGLGYVDLREANPDIVWMSSSGFGDSGAWSSWLAYGPAVRSASGLTSLWHYPDDPSEFGDTTTVYPDHAAARIAALTILSCLVRRRNQGGGANIRISQAEVVLNQLTEQFARDALGLTTTDLPGAPWGVYPCAGDDDWCVICVRDDTDWAQFSSALGNPSWCDEAAFADTAARRANQDALDAHVRAWCLDHSPKDVMKLLQDHGVPAGVMNRPTQLLDDPQLLARDYLAEQVQPGFDEPLNTVKRPFLARETATAPVRPSPSMGQNTVSICLDLLSMSHEDVERLAVEGVLQPGVDVQ